MKEPTKHLHPNNFTVQVYGAKLEPGDTLQDTDVYDSSSGYWERCPCPGLKLGEGVATVWVRPVHDSSKAFRGSNGIS